MSADALSSLLLARELTERSESDRLKAPSQTLILPSRNHARTTDRTGHSAARTSYHRTGHRRRSTHEQVSSTARHRSSRRADGPWMAHVPMLSHIDSMRSD